MKMVLSVILASMLQMSASAGTDVDCGTNAHAQKLASLIMAHESQQRTELECNGLLSELAEQRAMDLVEGPDPQELTPNQVLIKSGYKFPSFYPPVGNQVQAVANEVDTPESALSELVRSYQHRDLVLGDGEFFSRQSQIGVGYYENEQNEMQYVVFIAEPYSSPKLVIKQEFKAPTTSTEVTCGKTWRSSTNDEYRRVCRERFLEKKDEG